MCQINQIEQLKASNYDVALLLNLPLCEYDFNSYFQFKRYGAPQIIKPQFEDHYTVYPNPSKDFFIATFTIDETVDLNLSLVDIYGKEIRDYGVVESFVGENKAKLTTDGLRAGTYLIKFASG